jgi:hypothetical protein
MAISIYARAIETLPRYTDIPSDDVSAVLEAASAKWESV